ncbi:sugar ABC transporter permease [Acidithiobacillus thiooxidans]|uniref:carbohydrate ABC transporter permease n=1 Tax=Acidithiobacillus TaxID=119977 RepID=UPI00026252E1|nr:MULTISPECIES: sugar ABC transporter permease [Acidithiobacillus]MBU2742312.1 sugar ABC transporter permease [Acidithiobacillus albertensis]MBU2811163.1 sugar ABC transporter permease [Acidithiobacillus thiooxidans]MBU2836725.1 sugar ABC transporter permease [Acidithiobacillus thiooxidans]MDA8177242.1 sugar ABC transporter permease [Acidithiobacillus sp.]
MPFTKAEFSGRDRLMAKIVLSPTILAAIFFIYGFILWTIWLSLTRSTILPSNHFVGLANYYDLFGSSRWWRSLSNLGIFGGLYVLISLSLGLGLAILLDQRIKGERLYQVVFLYPMALSAVVTGVAWRWLLDPGFGLQAIVRSMGFPHFAFAWIDDPDMAIYTVVIAAVWQTTGFMMAIFLAGLRGVSSDIVKAAQIDGASNARIYLRVILPSLAPTFFVALVLSVGLAIKSFGLIIALTGGGPGYSTNVPSIFMYVFSFQRGEMGVGAASALMMLVIMMIFALPFLYLDSRRQA